MDEWRAKELWYTCDEKYFPGHRCKKLQLFIIKGKDSFKEKDKFEVVQKELESEPSIEEPSEPIISLHALAGSNSYQTMRVREYISWEPVIILIDSDSTHNFLDPMVAKWMGCLVEQTNFFYSDYCRWCTITSSTIKKKNAVGYAVPHLTLIWECCL